MSSPEADVPGDNMAARERDIEVEDFDNDSALGSEAYTATTSISESVYDYRHEHGRTYHAYKDGSYVFPNDEKEADRLDLQHEMFLMTLGDRRLHLAPVHNPKTVLDIGTGTGIWAIHFAERHPDCIVIGTDLSPMQPNLSGPASLLRELTDDIPSLPPNVKFQIDDAEDEWVFSDAPFDFIHLRIMAGCFKDNEKIIRQAYKNLKPGGWIEFQDYGLPLKAVDNSLRGTSIELWGEALCEAARVMGRPMGSDVSVHHKACLQKYGFMDIGEMNFMWPINMWPRDRFMKELGRYNLANMIQGVEGFCMALLTRGLGWSKLEVDILVAKCTNDFKNRNIHAYFPMPFVWGRKPFPEEINRRHSHLPPFPPLRSRRG